MITVFDKTPSTIMLESYNNKIKKLLQYNNLTAVSWKIGNTDEDGKTSIAFQMPSGTIKNITIKRHDIASLLTPDGEHVIVSNPTSTNDINLENIQKQVADASNIPLDVVSPDLAMKLTISTKIWATHGVYIPPQDYSLTDITDVQQLIDADAVYVLTALDTSLVYTGSITIKLVSNGSVTPPSENQLFEVDLSSITNCGIPGVWKTRLDSNNAISIQYLVGPDISNYVGYDSWAMQRTYKCVADPDWDGVTEGNIPYAIIPNVDEPLVRCVGKLHIDFELLTEYPYGIINLNDYGSDFRTSEDGTRFVIDETKDKDQVNQTIYEKIKLRADSGPSWADPTTLTSIDQLDFIELDTDVIFVRPNSESNGIVANGSIRVELERVPLIIKPYVVSRTKYSDSPVATVEVEEFQDIDAYAIELVDWFVEENKNNILTDVKAEYFDVLTEDDTVILIANKPEYSDFVQCDVTITFDRMIPRDPIINLDTVTNNGIPGQWEWADPDRSVEGFDLFAMFNEIMRDIISTYDIQDYNPVVADSGKLRGFDGYPNGQIFSEDYRVNALIKGRLSIVFQNHTSGAVVTDLSSMSNINVPGYITLSRSEKPTSNYNTNNAAYKAFTLATSGTHASNFNPSHSTIQYANNASVIKPVGWGYRPGTYVGTLKLVFIDYDDVGEWTPAINLSELTNNDSNGDWIYDAPEALTDENFIKIKELMLRDLSDAYGVDLTDLQAVRNGDVIELSIDPNKFTDAVGTLNVTIVEDSTLVYPNYDFNLNVTTSTTDQVYTIFEIRGANAFANVRVYRNDELIQVGFSSKYQNIVSINNSSDSSGTYLSVGITNNGEAGRSVDYTIVADANDIKLVEYQNVNPEISTLTVNKYPTNLERMRYNTVSPIVVPPPTKTMVDISDMFLGTKNYNQDISDWDVSHVTNMDNFLAYTPTFRHNLSEWCVPNITETPKGFVSGTAMSAELIPVWGTCPVMTDATGPDNITEPHVYDYDLSTWVQSQGSTPGYVTVTTSLEDYEDRMLEVLSDTIDVIITDSGLALTHSDFDVVTEYGAYKLVSSGLGQFVLGGLINVTVNYQAPL